MPSSASSSPNLSSSRCVASIERCLGVVIGEGTKERTSASARLGGLSVLRAGTRVSMLRLPMLRLSTLRLPMPIWFLERLSCRRFLTPAGAPKSSSGGGRGGRGVGEVRCGSRGEGHKLPLATILLALVNFRGRPRSNRGRRRLGDARTDRLREQELWAWRDRVRRRDGLRPQCLTSGALPARTAKPNVAFINRHGWYE